MKTVPLTNSDLEAYVDDEDYVRVSKLNWCLHERNRNTFYAQMTSRLFGHMSMHRFIIGDREDLQIDHIDENGLNNQKSNLRYVTQSKNLQGVRRSLESQSQYVGVTYNEVLAKWRARISVDNTRIHLGYFKSEKEAAIKYNEVATKIYGEDARLNLVKEINEESLT